MGKYIQDYSSAFVPSTKEACAYYNVRNNSSFQEHTSPIFKDLNFLKLRDLVSFQIALFMYKFHNQILPSAVFDNFFSTVASQHKTLERALTRWG